MSKEINIYLAAKMTGVDDYNHPAIIAEAIKLKSMTGCHIVVMRSIFYPVGKVVRVLSVN